MRSQRAGHTFLLFSHSVMSSSLRPHGLRHSRLPCSSLSHRVCSNSCPSSQWYHPTVSSSAAPFSSCLQSAQQQVFSNELALCIRWLKYWSFSFSISPCSEYSGFISFRIDWVDFFVIQGTLWVWVLFCWFYFLDSKYKWSNPIFVFFCPCYFT